MSFHACTTVSEMFSLNGLFFMLDVDYDMDVASNGFRVISNGIRVISVAFLCPSFG